MNVPAQDTHPSSEMLTAFAHGHLEDPDAFAVAEHLDICATCQQAVLAVPEDSMMALLRPAASTPVQRPELLGATTLAFTDGVPPELRDHARYQVQRRLGAGGMGVVYKAEHRLMERTVALKVIRPQLTASAAVVERFRREVRAVARLSHPNLVQAHDAEQAGALHFLVMEFVEGQDLASLVDRAGPLPIATACDHVRQAALGLAHAFGQGLVHRDVKPHNLMVTPQDTVKVLDFGLASIAAECGGAGGLTEFGQGMGTPDYMAPEQIRDARSVDTRADIYSLGCTLYFLLTGQPPFPEGNPAAKMAAHLEKQPPPVQQLRPEVPAELVRAIERMMAKEPDQRLQTPAAVVAALEPFTVGQAALPVPASDRDRQGCLSHEPFRHIARPDRDRPRVSPRRKLLLGTCLVLVFVLGMAGTLILRTNDGTIVLENLPANAEVLVDGNKVSVKLGDGGKVIEVQVAPGKRKLVFKCDGLEFETEEVTVAAGERKPLRVRRVPPPEAPLGPVVSVEAGDRAPDLSNVMPLIDDDFRDPETSHFPALRDKKNGNDFRFENCGYVISKGTGAYAWIRTPCTVEGDFACQVVGRARTDGDSGWGMVLATHDDNRALAIRLHNEGAVEVSSFGRVGKMGDLIVDPIRHPAVRSDGEPNTLLVILRAGKSLEIYVNGTVISRPIQLTQPLAPRVAQGVISWSREAECRRFTVWLLPRPASGDGNRPPDLSGLRRFIDGDFGDPDKRVILKEFNSYGTRGFFEKGHYVMQHFFKRDAEGWGFMHDCWAGPVNVNPVTGDLACEVVGRVLTERDSGWAVGLFTPDKNRDVGVRLRRDGAVEVGNFHWRDTAVTMVGPIRHSAIQPGNTFTTLLVVLRDGQRLEIYVNGAAVGPPIQLEQRLAPAVFPGVGLWERTGHPEQKARAEFSRFTAWELPPLAQAKP